LLEAGTGQSYTQITLFELIDLLTGMGAENIIFIDLSCSIFSSDSDTNISKRTIRTLRRDLKKSKIFGGRKRNKSKKNKTRKQRKTIKNNNKQ